MLVEKIETRHGTMVHDVKWDYSGKRLAIASSDAVVKIMGLSHNSELQLLATLTGHQGPVRQLAWGHPKFGSILASCSGEGRVIIWKEGNQNEWKEFRVFDEHKSSVNCISWAPHELGLCLACGSSDGSILVLTARSDGGWDTKLVSNAHPGGVTSLSWAPATVQNGSELHNLVHKLASGGCDNTMKVWKLCNGTWKMDCYPEVQMHSDSERDLASAPIVGLPKVTIPSTLDRTSVTTGEGRYNRWQFEEDELLIRAWLDSYKDTNVGDDQKMMSFWNRVLKYFEENRRGGVPRTETMLIKRFYRTSVAVKKFVECYDQACQQCQSETDKKGIMAAAHKLYKSQNGGRRFNLVHAWIRLKDEPKWKAHANLLSCEDYPALFASPDTLTNRNIGSSKVCDNGFVAQSCWPNHVEKLTSTGYGNTMKVSAVCNRTQKPDCSAATQTQLDEPIGRAYVNLSPCGGDSKRMKVSGPGACMSLSNPDVPKSRGVFVEVCDVDSVVKPLNSVVKPLESKVESKGQGKSKGVLVKELHAIKSAELKKASALEELARTKQMEIDMQVIFKDTSSMNKEQLQFHVRLVQQLKQKYLL